jgi:hypothetical protein
VNTNNGLLQRRNPTQKTTRTTRGKSGISTCIEKPHNRGQARIKGALQRRTSQKHVRIKGAHLKNRRASKVHIQLTPKTTTLQTRNGAQHEEGLEDKPEANRSAVSKRF